MNFKKATIDLFLIFILVTCIAYGIKYKDNYNGKALAELKDEKIVVLDADLDKSTKTSYFKEKNPKRFIEMGISEADMISTAAGDRKSTRLNSSHP